jgi:flagellar biosynthetic protein FliR
VSSVRLPEIATSEVVGFVLVMARVGGIFFFAPVFSSKMIPARAKLIAAGALSLAIAPLATDGKALPLDPLVLGSLLGKEVLVGLAFALALGVLSAAVQAAASLLDTLVGFSFAALVDPFTNAQSAVLGQLYGMFATMVFLLTGGDHVVVMGLARSYDLLPLGAMPAPGHLAELATTGLADIAIIGLQIAAPVLLALVITDAAFGLVARAVPQVNVLVVGLPAKILVAFAVAAASLPFVAEHLRGELERSVAETLRLLG